MDAINFICDYCNEPFTPGRSDAKFCSSQCRVRSHRQQRSSDGAVIVNEVIDAHGRATRLWVTVRPTSGGLINMVLSSTFSGAQRPNDHRVVYQTALPPESLSVIRDAISAAIDPE